MRNLPRMIALPLSLLCSAPSLASEGYTVPAPISDFGARELSLDLYVPQATSPMGCSQVGWFRLKAAAMNHDLIAAFLLTQFSQQKSVRLYVNGCDADGESLIVAARST